MQTVFRTYWSMLFLFFHQLFRCNFSRVILAVQHASLSCKYLRVCFSCERWLVESDIRGGKKSAGRCCALKDVFFSPGWSLPACSAVFLRDLRRIRNWDLHPKWRQRVSLPHCVHSAQEKPRCNAMIVANSFVVSHTKHSTAGSTSQDVSHLTSAKIQ